MGKPMEELNTCEDWKQVKRPPSLSHILDILELDSGEAYVSKAERKREIGNGMATFFTPYPTLRPREPRLKRAHVRVKPEKAFRRNQVRIDRYTHIELYNTGQKRTKGEGRGLYYSRNVPGLFAEKPLRYVKETKVYLKEHGHKLPEGMKRTYKRRIRKVQNETIPQYVVESPRFDRREFSIGEGENQYIVTLHEYEGGRFRVLCDSLPSFPKERIYHTSQFVRAISCYKKWCEQARKAWVENRDN